MKRRVIEYGREEKARRPFPVPAAVGGVFLLTILVCAGGGWAPALYRLLTDGVLCLLWLTGAWGIGAAVLGRTRAWPSALDLITEVATGLGALSTVALGLGLAGWLNRGTAWGLVVLGCAAAGVVARRRGMPEIRETTGHWRWLWLAAAPFLGIAVAGAMMPAGVLWGDEPHGYDVVEYHLQVPREWYESGRIVPLGHNAFSYFPFNVEMHYLLAMHLRGGPWAGMFLAQLMHAGFCSLAVLAVYGVVSEISDRKRAVIAAAAMAAVPWTAMLGAVAYNEGGVLLWGALAVGWAVRGVRGQGSGVRNWVTAGIMAGFACGAKLTAVPMLIVGIPVGLLIARGKTGPGRAGSLGIGAFWIAAVVAFAPWLVRNWAWVGNPVFPEGTSVFGTRGRFDAVQVERWKEANHWPDRKYRSAVGKAAAVGEQIVANWRFGYVLLPVGIAAWVLVVLRRREVRAEAMVVGGVFLVLLVFWVGFTHLQGRFFTLAVPLAAIALGMAPWPKWSGAAVGVMVVIGIVSLGTRWAGFVDRGMTQFLGFEGWDQEKLWKIDPIAPQATLVLVGDARAYLYQRPMAKLSYRTVFDVRASEGQSIVEAWANGGGDGRRVLLVVPDELVRLQKTYYGLPPVPSDVAARPEPFVVEGK